MATISEKDKIMKLSQAEYETLSTTGTLTKDGVTHTYSPSDTIYVTPFEGGGGTIDTEMSDDSTNAVQNKVIKSYVDTSIDMTIGDAMMQILGGGSNE